MMNLSPQRIISKESRVNPCSVSLNFKDAEEGLNSLIIFKGKKPRKEYTMLYFKNSLTKGYEEGTYNNIKFVRFYDESGRYFTFWTSLLDKNNQDPKDPNHGKKALLAFLQASFTNRAAFYSWLFWQLLQNQIDGGTQRFVLSKEEGHYVWVDPDNLDNFTANRGGSFHPVDLDFNRLFNENPQLKEEFNIVLKTKGLGYQLEQEPDNTPNDPSDSYCYKGIQDRLEHETEEETPLFYDTEEKYDVDNSPSIYEEMSMTAFSIARYFRIEEYLRIIKQDKGIVLSNDEFVASANNRELFDMIQFSKELPIINNDYASLAIFKRGIYNPSEDIVILARKAEEYIINGGDNAITFSRIFHYAMTRPNPDVSAVVDALKGNKRLTVNKYNSSIYNNKWEEVRAELKLLPVERLVEMQSEYVKLYH